jgi:hypothetical protein
MSIIIKPSDKAFADCLKAAHDYTCERCGKQGRMETSHVYSRKHRTIRWCKDNANCLCNYCHRIWHDSPLDAFYWFDERYGEARRLFLIEKMNNRNKVSKLEEKDIAKHYKEQLKIVEERRNSGEMDYIDFVSWQ